jgi:AcrR family transcriptional regulator
VKAAPGRREQNKQDKRGRITAAARALFTHKGFDATTTQEIADAAGVGSGTIFTYAKTKEDLLILVFHDEMMEIVGRASALTACHTSLLDQCIAFFEVMVVYHERDIPLGRALFRQLGYVSSADQRDLVSQLMTSVLGGLARLVEAAKSDNQVDATQPAYVAARTLFAVYYFHLGGMLNGYIDRPQFDRALRTDLGLLLSGLNTAGR